MIFCVSTTFVKISKILFFDGLYFIFKKFYGTAKMFEKSDLEKKSDGAEKFFYKIYFLGFLGFLEIFDFWGVGVKWEVLPRHDKLI